MDLEKYRKYAKRKIRASEMKKEIHDYLDKFKTAQRAGYEAAKIQYKPLLEAQEAQLKAQEAQTKTQEKQLSLQKTEVFSKAEQEFITAYGLPLPSTLIAEGMYAYKTGIEEGWKERLLNLSLDVTRIIEGTDDPNIKNAAAKYQKSLQKAVAMVVRPQKQQQQTIEEKSSTPEENLSSTPSTETIAEVDKLRDAAQKVYDYPLEIETQVFLEEQQKKLPSEWYLEGAALSEKGGKEYHQWGAELNNSLRDIKLSSGASKKSKKHMLDQYIQQLEEVKAALPPILAADTNFNQGFTTNDQKYWKTQGWQSPHEIFLDGVDAKLKSPEDYKEWRDKIEELLKTIKKQNSNPAFQKSVARRNKYHDKVKHLLALSVDVKQVGTGIRRKKYTMGGNIFMNPQDLFNKLELITGSIISGNSSQKIRNDAYRILDKLLSIKLITKTIYNKYIKEYLLH